MNGILTGIRAVLYDFDGTLADSTDLIMRCYRHTMSTHLGDVPPDEDWLSGFGMTLESQLQRFARTPDEALAMLDTCLEERLFEKAIELGDYWEAGLHSLRGLPNVIDIRNFGLVGAVELQPREGAPGARAYEAFVACFHDHDMLVRTTGDVIAVSPPLILGRDHVDQIVERLGAAIRGLA